MIHDLSVEHTTYKTIQHTTLHNEKKNLDFMFENSLSSLSILNSLSMSFSVAMAANPFSQS
jgi:hypothetical protein